MKNKQERVVRGSIGMLDLQAEYLYMKEDIDASIGRCLEHQQWVFGPEVKEFENKVAEYLGVKNCVGVSSGTDALVLALRALAVKTKGQEYFDRTDLIITTPFTFTATGDAILRAGATPLFVDIDPSTYNINPSLIRHCSTQYPKVVGLLPVHLYGQPCQMDEIMSVAAEYGLFVVEDCAQSFGAMWKDKKLGSIGSVGAFSFFPSKNLGGFGDAGMVSTNDDEICDLVRVLVKHGGRDKYNAGHIGYNARIDTIQAAILLAKLKYIDEFNTRRRAIAGAYTRKLSRIDGILLPAVPEYFETPCRNAISASSPVSYGYHVFHQYTIRVCNGHRDALRRYLQGLNIDSMIYYPVPLHKMRLFSDKNCRRLGDCDVAATAADSVVSLPVEPLYGDTEIEAVSQAIRDYFVHG